MLSNLCSINNISWAIDSGIRPCGSKPRSNIYSESDIGLVTFALGCAVQVCVKKQTSTKECLLSRTVSELSFCYMTIASLMRVCHCFFFFFDIVFRFFFFTILHIAIISARVHAFFFFEKQNLSLCLQLVPYAKSLN